MDYNVWYYGNTTYGRLRNGASLNVYPVRMAYKLNSQDEANRTSNITLELQCQSNNPSYYTYGAVMSPKIDNVPLASKTIDMRNTGVWQTFASITKNVQHNDEGKLTYTATGEFTVDVSSSVFSPYSLSSGNASAEFELPIIETVSTITATDATIGSTLSVITIDKKAESLKTTIEYKYDGANDYVTLVDKTSARTVNFDVPNTAYQYMRASSVVGCTIKASTYSANNTKIGESTTTININAGTGIEPIIRNVTIRDSVEAITALTGSPTRFLADVSRPEVSWEAVAQQFASIVSQKVGGVSTSSPYVYNYMPSVDNCDILVTDSRGNENIYNFFRALNVTVVDYIRPTILANVSRAKPTSNELLATVSGNFYNGAFDVQGQNLNSLLIQCFYREYSEDVEYSWTPITIDNANIKLSGKAFQATDLNLGDVFNYKKDWELYFTVQDALGEVYETPKQVIRYDTSWYNVRIPIESLTWFKNGQLVSNPQFEANLRVLQLGINENYNAIQDLQQIVIHLGDVNSIKQEIIDRKQADAELAYAIESLAGRLTDYYDKTEIDIKFTDVESELLTLGNKFTNYYTKAEVNDIVASLSTLNIEIVNVLPAVGESNIIYFVPATSTSLQDYYDEFIYISDAWEKIGSTRIDLSNYYTKDDVDGLVEEIYGAIDDIDLSALNVQVTDLGGYFTSSNAEGVLQEIGATLNGIAEAVQEQSEVIA